MKESAMSTVNRNAVVPAPKVLEFERLLDSDEAASLLKIHPKTLQRLARQKRIVGVQIGKLWRFRVSALDDFLRAKMAS
jgi:excisionase family DNA binding protein